MTVVTRQGVAPRPARELLASVREALEDEVGVAAVYVYGSVARGRATPLSDLDVAIVASASVEKGERAGLQRRLLTLLERRIHGCRVDVRFLDELPVAVRGRVVGEGVRVLEKDAVLRVREEVRARMEYHDFAVFERAALGDGLRALRRKAGGG